MRLPCLAVLFAATALGALKPEDVIPSSLKPFVPPATEARGELSKTLTDYMATPAAEVKAHPAAKEFPGSVDSPDRVARKVAYDANLIHRWDTSAGNAPNLATGPEVWQETGLYAAPGEVVTVKAASLPDFRIVRIVIGCHRDKLFKLDKWSRFPLINRSFDLQVGETKVANAFGGQIFIMVQNGPLASKRTAPGKPTVIGNFSLDFSNAVAASTYVLGKDTLATWKETLKSPAPWATLVTKNVILHVRTAQLLKLEDPQPLLEWWDKVLGLEDDLIALQRLAPERVVPDIQISAGFMHSGYPFMCQLKASEKEIFDLEGLKKKGNWGFFHELGHNHQRTDWTFTGQTEVTCNLFSLYVMEKLVGMPTGQGHGAMKNLEQLMSQRLATPANMGFFEQLAPFVALVKAHGWEPLRATLRSYADQPVKGDEASRKNIFVVRYGQFAKADVSDFFGKLGYPITPETKAALMGFPGYTYAPTPPASK